MVFIRRTRLGQVASAERGCDPQRLVLRDLCLETHGHAVLLPDKGVTSQTQRVLARLAVRLAVEKEVRLTLEPEAARAIDRDGLDLRTRSGSLAEQDLLDRAAELADQHRDPDLLRLRDAGAFAIREGHALGRAACFDKDVVRRAQLRRHADREVDTAA